MLKTKVGIYIRVSTQEQASEGYSIHEQEERLTKYVEAQGWTLYKVYSDPGFSGAKIDRPGLNSLISDIKRNKLDKVIVYKLDRLSRSQKDTLYLIEDVFIKNDVDFISMTESFDTSTPLGRAMIGILSVFAQLERENIKERMQVGLDARAKDGYYHGGGYAPIGYDYVDGELIVNQYEALQIKKIYELFFDDVPIHAIFTLMNEQGYTHKYGTWKHTAVRSCLSSVVYTGRILWKDDIYEGRHEAIIDIDTFNKAQQKIKERQFNDKYRKHPFKRTSLLGGLIFCGNCGARYFVKQNTSRRPGITPANKYYTCYSRGKSSKDMIKDPNCKNKSYNVKELNEIILNEINKLAIDESYLKSIIDDNKPENKSADISILQKRLDQIDTQINKLVDLYQIGSLDFNVINDKIQKLNTEKATIEYELDNGYTMIAPPDLSIKETKFILKTFNQALESDDLEELKKIVNSLINSIIIKGEDIEIRWKFI